MESKPTTAQAATQPEEKPWDANAIIGKVFAQYDYELTSRDAILYSLSLGFNQDPMRRDDYKFTYENAEGFQAFPTMPVVIIHKDNTAFMRLEGLPPINPMMVLHGSEIVNVVKPLEIGKKYKIVQKLRDVVDKKKFTLLVGEHTVSAADNDKDVYATIVGQSVVKGFPTTGLKAKTKLTKFPARPTEAPHHISEVRIAPGQAFLYRLNGDYNPLHVDPDMAAIGGFKFPILHGLCTKGVCAKTVYEKYALNQPDLIKRVGSQFVGHVFPGETLVVEMWRKDNFIYYEAKVKERGATAMKAFMELKGSSPTVTSGGADQNERPKL